MRFPKMHIAQSVANRILNIANEVRPTEIAPGVVPHIPDSSILGKKIDKALSQSGVAATPAPGAENAMLQAGLEGESLLDEAIAAEVIDSA